MRCTYLCIVHLPLLSLYVCVCMPPLPTGWCLTFSPPRLFSIDVNNIYLYIHMCQAKLFMVSYGLACAYIGLHLKQCRRNIELAQKVSYVDIPVVAVRFTDWINLLAFFDVVIVPLSFLYIIYNASGCMLNVRLAQISDILLFRFFPQIRRAAAISFPTNHAQFP